MSPPGRSKGESPSAPVEVRYIHYVFDVSRAD